MPKHVDANWLNGNATADYLGITTMCLWDWERDPAMAFPPPAVIRDRKYWCRSDLDAWMRRRIVAAAGKPIAQRRAA